MNVRAYRLKWRKCLKHLLPMYDLLSVITYGAMMYSSNALLRNRYRGASFGGANDVDMSRIMVSHNNHELVTQHSLITGPKILIAWTSVVPVLGECSVYFYASSRIFPFGMSDSPPKMSGTRLHCDVSEVRLHHLVHTWFSWVFTSYLIL